MNRDLVLRRLAAVENTVGPIVGTAAWCALHAAHAHVIFSCIDERLRDAEATPEQRAGLLFVVHELLLTCAAKGASEEGRREVLGAASAVLPGALGAAAALPDPSGVFTVALSRAVGWWGLLRLFPAAWLAQVRGGAPEAGEDEGGEAPPPLLHAVPPELQPTARHFAKYAAARQRFAAVAAAPGAAREEAREAAVRQLTQLLRAVDGRDGAAGGLLPALHAELAALTGVAEPGLAPSVLRDADAVGAGHAASIPTAAAAPAPSDQDDVLGSFF